MKETVLILLLLAALVGGATWYGLHRGDGGGAPKPEVSQRVMLARKFLDSNEPKKALEVFAELDAKGHRYGEDGDIVRLAALNKAGRQNEVAEAAAKFTAKYPNSKRHDDVELLRLRAELALKGLDDIAVRTAVEEFLAAHPDQDGAVTLHAALARHHAEAGRLDESLEHLEAVLSTASDHKDVFEAASIVGRANMERLFSPARGEGDTAYQVKSGDSINKIARSYKMTDELLLKCNGITDPRRLRPGQTLKVPNVDFSLHVDVTANTLVVRNAGKFFNIYPVRTGREAGTTPTGEFKILNKKANPTWKPGDGRVYLPGDPANELGTRWMSFEGDILGIHGTLHPESVGEYASNGCVGMLKEDVEELFDMINVGTPLTINGEPDFTRHNVIPAPDVRPPQQLAKL